MPSPVSLWDHQIWQAELRCPRCKSRPCQIKKAEEWSKLGVGTKGLFRAFVVTLQCAGRSSCKFAVSVVDPGFQALLPVGTRTPMPFDRVHDRIYQREITDFMCNELRTRYNGNALRLSLASHILTSVMADWPVGRTSADLVMQGLLYGFFVVGLPRSDELVAVVVIAFQHFERPHVESQIKLVVARCGWILIFDGGSAPLQETRQHPAVTKIRGPVEMAIMRRIGGAIAVHGLFDVPLLPWVYVGSETQIDLAIIGAYIIYLLRSMNIRAGILGWVDDCTERSFNQSTRALEHTMETEVFQGKLVVDRVACTVRGLLKP